MASVQTAKRIPTKTKPQTEGKIISRIKLNSRKEIRRTGKGKDS
jgi:hypothetical protein